MPHTEPEAEDSEHPPSYAAFRHPDGRWYRLWMTHTMPKTSRGHPWHLHASYDLEGSLEPSLDEDWQQTAYGISNWDFYSYEEALDAFLERFRLRLEHGYRVIETTTESIG